MDGIDVKRLLQHWFGNVFINNRWPFLFLIFLYSCLCIPVNVHFFFLLIFPLPVSSLAILFLYSIFMLTLEWASSAASARPLVPVVLNHPFSSKCLSSVTHKGGEKQGRGVFQLNMEMHRKVSRTEIWPQYLMSKWFQVFISSVFPTLMQYSSGTNRQIYIPSATPVQAGLSRAALGSLRTRKCFHLFLLCK